MSLLSFNFGPDEVTIVSDGINVAGMTPHHFGSKAIPIPHLGIVVAGIGVTRLVADWAALVAFHSIADNLDDLAAVAEAWLPGRDRYVNPHPGDCFYGGHTVIYHFGPDVDGRYVCDEFDRGTGFRRIRRDPGFWCRPMPEDGLVEAPATLVEWIALAQDLKIEHATTEPPILIGGRLSLVTMSKIEGGYSWIQVIPSLHKFSDADEMQAGMRARAIEAEMLRRATGP
ncbi:MAG TPA: hypothetical protein VNQ73_14795 [Ilumatobacter sp.]|nr:hypothetical protein [Ilumatobacter sp.]